MSERRTFAVIPTGKGRPDYQGEQWRAKTEKTIIHSLHQNEAIVTFNLMPTNEPLGIFPAPYHVPAIAVGARQALVDASDGTPITVAVPYRVEIGFELQIVLLEHTMNQNVCGRIYFGAPPIPPQLASEIYLDAMTLSYESEVIMGTTMDFDPAFNFVSTIAIVGENLGNAPLVGYTKIECILRDHRTKRPTTKTVNCRWCGHKKVEPLNTTVWKCPKCGKHTRFKAFVWGGQVRLPAGVRLRR